MVIDADAIGHIGEPERLRGHDAIITPHDGEFAKLFPDLEGDKPTARSPPPPRPARWWSTRAPTRSSLRPTAGSPSPRRPRHGSPRAGTGDVLAGMIAALRARGLPSFDAACAAVWLHGRAAEQAGPGMIADDLVGAIPRASPTSHDRPDCQDRGARRRSQRIGQHVAFAVPGDAILADGSARQRPRPPSAAMPSLSRMRRLPAPAPHRRRACRFRASRIAGALAQHGLEAPLRPTHLSPPRTRRRASLKALRAGGRVLLGFNAAGSHQIVDLRECHVLHPGAVRTGRAAARAARRRCSAPRARRKSN